MAKKEKEQSPLLDEEGNEALDRLATQVDTAVELIRDLRKERDELASRAEELEKRVEVLEEDASRAKELEKQQSGLEKEKAEIRKRIESILEKFEGLDIAE